jgi:hypothetical protein
MQNSSSQFTEKNLTYPSRLATAIAVESGENATSTTASSKDVI